MLKAGKSRKRIGYVPRSEPLRNPHSLPAISSGPNRCPLRRLIMHFSAAVRGTIMRRVTPLDNTHSACRWKPIEKSTESPSAPEQHQSRGEPVPTTVVRTLSAFICKSLRPDYSRPSVVKTHLLCVLAFCAPLQILRRASQQRSYGVDVNYIIRIT